MVDGEEIQVAAIDATFKFCPRYFKQVLCIHLIKNTDGRSHAFPIAICAMTRKTALLYNRVFRTVKELSPSFQPSQVMSDFEAGLRNGFASEYNDASIKGSWFLYKQAITKKTKTVFTLEQRMNADLKDWLLSILSVPLLPADRMHEAFDNLLVQHVPGVDTTRFKRYIR